MTEKSELVQYLVRVHWSFDHGRHHRTFEEWISAEMLTPEHLGPFVEARMLPLILDHSFEDNDPEQPLFPMITTVEVLNVSRRQLFTLPQLGIYNFLETAIEEKKASIFYRQTRSS